MLQHLAVLIMSEIHWRLCCKFAASSAPMSSSLLTGEHFSLLSRLFRWKHESPPTSGASSAVMVIRLSNTQWKPGKLALNVICCLFQIVRTKLTPTLALISFYLQERGLMLLHMPCIVLWWFWPRIQSFCTHVEETLTLFQLIQWV